MSIRIAVIGASGRMGREILALLGGDPRFVLQQAVVSSVSARNTGTEQGAVPPTTLADGLHPDVQGVIDFSVPKSSLIVTAHCAERGIPLLIGTTGFSAEEMSTLTAHAKRAPILIAANTSLGVAALTQLVERARTMLGDDFDVEISETHHRQKRDAPSGTALALAEAVKRVATDERCVSNRHGPRSAGEIGVSSLRGGTIFGEHTVHFFGNGETISLTHRADNRTIFARGALDLMARLYGKGPGLYAVRDLYGFGGGSFE